MTELNATKPPGSLLDGVEATVCEALGITRLRHRSALRSLKVTSDTDLPAIVQRTVADNWIDSGAAANRDRSRQNWRWTLQPQIGTANRSPEVILERAIASACAAAGRNDWANQIPVASGLIAGAAAGRRAIDLAERHGDRHFELIELKIFSDTALYAAVELLGYASLWLLARKAPPAHAPVLLSANRLDLRVLAPVAFYTPFQLSELERSIDAGVRSLGEENDVTLSFAFDVLPDGAADQPTENGSLLETMANRRRLHGDD